MSEPLDELYLKWLYEQVADPEVQEQEMTYWEVLNLLFQKEFTPTKSVPFDENRAQDGKALRIDFIRECDIQGEMDSEWMEFGCSMLELMVGLSRRLAFLADGRPHYWFWIMMGNLGLNGLNDKKYFTKRTIERVNNILDDVIERNYEPSGRGGLFPLESPREDQRTQEIWHQMNEYVLENLY